MTLSDLCLRRPVFATVVSLLIILFGLAALMQLPVRELPDVDRAIVSVNVDYTGAAPEVIDTQITSEIESAVAGIAGVRSISSESERGSGRTVIEFETTRDIDDAANDVRSAVARIVNRLPEDAEEPRVRKSDSDDSPVMRLTLTSDRVGTDELTDYAQRHIVDRLATVDGVASVDLYGERDYAIRIWLDRRAMAAREVTVLEVAAALRQNNLELPAGEIETANRLFQVRTNSRLSNVEEFEKLVVKTADGYPILLRDVASVELGVEDDSRTYRGNLQAAVGIGVLRQSQANTMQISDRISAEVEAIGASLPPGMSLSVGSDDAIFIRSSIMEVAEALVIAMILVVAVILAFFASVRATLVPAITIPISLIGACAGIAIFGYSINILTLFALLLAIGLVVDDAIVVLENIQRRVERGESRLLASALGAKQVQFAVLATSITLIAVFVPISFLQGTVGRLFSEFGVVLAIAVAVSTFVALSLCPVLCANVLPKERERGRMERVVNAALNRLNNGYAAALRAALTVPWLVVGIAVVISAAAFVLYERLPRELTPREDRAVFFVTITAPQGSNTNYTDIATRKVEQIIAPYLQDGTVRDVITIVGRWGEPHRATVVARLAHWSEREKTQQQIIAEITPELRQITQARAFPGSPAGLGLRGSNSPLRVVVGGPDFDSVEGWSKLLLARMRENPNLRNVETDYEKNQPGFRISINRDRARDLGIEVRTISEALQTLFASTEITEYVDRGRQYPVIVQARDEDRTTPSDLKGVFIRAPRSGELVSLSGLVSVTEQANPRALNRYDRLPSIQISASLADGYDMGSAIDAVRAAAAEVLPPTARVSFAGQSKEFLETSAGAELTFLLAILIVYLVLAAQFESFIHPIVIMLSVPMAVTGALLTLFLTGDSLNVFSQVGLVLLVGLMAKNGILIVEFANQLRDEGYSVRDAIMEGSVLRLRPILMTVIATVFGAVPLALASGAGAESRISIGVVIIGGFGVASVLTLFLTPVLYDLLARYTKPRGALEQRLNAVLNTGSQAATRQV